ncbi:MAG: GNAT family N-acetyltransferase [Candidatus Thorarchaeota archaeon]
MNRSVIWFSIHRHLFVDGKSSSCNMPKIYQFGSENEERVLSIIGQNPLENIILIADCTQLRKWCDVRVLSDNEDIKAVFSVYKDLDFLAGAFWATDTENLEKIVKDFKEDLRSKDLILICTSEQLVILRPLCAKIEPTKERQMVCDCTNDLTSWGDADPIPLTMDDADSLRELYRLSGTPAWTSSVMNLGPFYGIRDGEGQVIAVAGVHYVTPYGSEIGNVATHPDYKRRGLASNCVVAVTEALLEKTPRIFLHFFDDNEPARRLYERMGFQYSDVDPIYFTRIMFNDSIF